MSYSKGILKWNRVFVFGLLFKIYYILKISRREAVEYIGSDISTADGAFGKSFGVFEQFIEQTETNGIAHGAVYIPLDRQMCRIEIPMERMGCKMILIGDGDNYHGRLLGVCDLMGMCAEDEKQGAFDLTAKGCMNVHKEKVR